MALNVTTAVFGENCNTATASPSLAQWDKGQVLQISGVDLPDAYQVEFSTVYTRNAIPVIGNASGVQVPNELLQRSAPITACVVLHSTANSRDTEYWVTIHITPRKPPETITPDPEQQDVIDQAIAALQDGTARAEAAATAAAGSATEADGNAENAEAWAVGQRAGEDVPDTDPTYRNNAKYYAGAAEAAAEEAGQHEASWESWVRRAEAAADDAEGSARAAAGSKADATAAAQTATQKATEAGNSAGAAAGSASEARQTVDGSIGAINTAKEGALTAIGSAGSNAVGAVNQAGTTQTERVTTEGNTQVNRVQEKGDEVIGSIPQDYTNLVDDVADLSRHLSDVEGNQIPELKNAISQLQPAATQSDVGKAIIVKTVDAQTGKPTSYEYGEAGGGLDATLMDATKAAQAKAVGDIVHMYTYQEPQELEITTRECYNKTTGAVQSYDVNTAQRTDLIDVSGWVKAVITCNQVGAFAGVCFYDENMVFISSALEGQNVDAEVTLPANCKYIGVSSIALNIAITAVKYVTIKQVVDAIIAANDGDAGKILAAKTIENGVVKEWEFLSHTIVDPTLSASGRAADAKQTGDRIAELEYPWGTYEEQYTPEITSGEYYKSADGSIATYVAYKRTNLIDLAGWAGAKVSLYTVNASFAGVCFYRTSSVDSYIEGSCVLNDQVRYTDEPVTIPNGAKYMGVSSHQSASIAITAIKYKTYSDIEDEIDEIGDIVLNGSLDKNVVFFGDSITTELHEWIPALKNIMSFKSLTNYARGYCTWSFQTDTVYDITSTGNTRTSDNVIWNQYNRLVADVENNVVAVPDAIIITAGTNDAIYNSNVGSVADAMAISDIRTQPVGTLNNVCASIRRVIEDIFATFPYTKIIICTPIQSGQSSYQTRLLNIVPCIREICSYYSIEGPDLFKDCGISYYIEKDADIYLTAGDGGIHPTEAGGKLMANFMKAWLMSHYSYAETIEKTYVPQS